MPLMRNPFRRAPDDQLKDENGRPISSGGLESESPKPTGHRPAPLDIRPDGVKQPTEYKLSEINDSGVYLPPSPTEKPKFFSTRSHTSTNSSSQRSAVTDSDNPFTISRESFDSYRRSFDISARSPVFDADVHRARQSLDARRLRHPSAVLKDHHVNLPETQPEDRFEDVGLTDDPTTRPKKPGIFSRFGHSSVEQSSTPQSDGSRPSSSHFGSQLFGRKRGSSGHGAELGSMPRGPAKDDKEPKETPSTDHAPKDQS